MKMDTRHTLPDGSIIIIRENDCGKFAYRFDGECEFSKFTFDTAEDAAQDAWLNRIGDS